MLPDDPAYAIPPRISEIREAGGRVVFTNGCFDLLHPGHVFYLRVARSLGDALVVGLNSDASVRRLKGPSRPVVPEKDRATMLVALESVDAVILFGEDTPVRLLRELKPAVYVKGGDYAAVPGDPGKPLPEAAIVRAYGGAVHVLPFTPDRSTSGIVERIVARYCPPVRVTSDQWPVASEDES